MVYIIVALRKEVYERAEDRCEYCLIHQDDTFLSHEIDHIYAEKHGGTTDEGNLCLSCFFCNRHKGSDIASLEDGEIIPLFHPRHDDWSIHFAIQKNGKIIGRTAVGRVTVRLLQINTPDRILERQQLIELGQFPR